MDKITTLEPKDKTAFCDEAKKYAVMMQNIGFAFIVFISVLSIVGSVPSNARASATSEGQTGEFLKDNWVPPFMLMAEQLTAGMIQQVEIIGTFFDAKHQLETQRLFQQKTAEAHKDYHPSEQMCEIGTFVRDLSRSDERTKVTRNAIQNAALTRALASGDVKTVKDKAEGSDQLTRRDAYIDHFCNIHDNANQNNLLCETSKHVAQQNADVNFTQIIDFPLTLDVDLLNADITRDERNLFAFLDQIFMNDSFPLIPRGISLQDNAVKPLQEMRSLVAMRSVAQNSFAHIIGEKTAGPAGPEAITPFIHSLLFEMGLELEDIRNDYIGANPSYYAQMEILTKKIYQHPEFISNLYDKPANVKRIRTALSAIKLMQDRDIHNAMQRREMLTSMILELKVRNEQNDLTNEIRGIIDQLPEVPSSVYGGGEANQFGVGTFNENSGGGGF